MPPTGPVEFAGWVASANDLPVGADEIDEHPGVPWYLGLHAQFVRVQVGAPFDRGEATEHGLPEFLTRLVEDRGQD